MIGNTIRRQANNSTNTTGGGPVNKPGGAPQLPDAVPDGVQALLDGIFGFGGDVGQAFGDLVSGLARAIEGPAVAQQLVALGIDVAGVLV